MFCKPKNDGQASYLGFLVHTFDKGERLLGYLTSQRSDKGGTRGSHVAFISDEHATILLHKEHPRKELVEYQVK